VLLLGAITIQLGQTLRTIRKESSRARAQERTRTEAFENGIDTLHTGLATVARRLGDSDSTTQASRRRPTDQPRGRQRRDENTKPERTRDNTAKSRTARKRGDQQTTAEELNNSMDEVPDQLIQGESAGNNPRIKDQNTVDVSDSEK
jgi:hypothetical protein